MNEDRIKLIIIAVLLAATFFMAGTITTHKTLDSLYETNGNMMLIMQNTANWVESQGNYNLASVFQQLGYNVTLPPAEPPINPGE